MTPRQTRFVAEYLVDQNAMQAAIRAGYKPDSAQANASRLMDKDGIREAIEAGMALLVKKTGITAERVLEQMGRLAFSDLRKAFDADGRLKPPGEWDDDTAAAMAGIDVVTVSKGQGEVEYVAKIRMTDKRAALADIARVLGMNKDSLEMNGRVVVQAIRRVIIDPKAVDV